MSDKSQAMAKAEELTSVANALNLHIAAQDARLNAYEHVLRINAVKFRFYEQQHLAKGTTESAVKAAVNRGMAEMIEAVLK